MQIKTLKINFMVKTFDEINDYYDRLASKRKMRRAVRNAIRNSKNKEKRYE